MACAYCKKNEISEYECPFCCSATNSNWGMGCLAVFTILALFLVSFSPLIYLILAFIIGGPG